MLQREATIFFAALRFFTRLPVPAWVGHSADQLNHAARYFPLVGLIVGAIGAGVTLAAALVWSQAIAVLLGMVATLLVTGAFHEDGLADSIDGFGGGWTRTDVLAIMKDSRIGSYGAIGIGMALLLKFFALMQLLAALPAPAFALVLIAGHGVSRLASTTLILCLDYARDDPGIPTFGQPGGEVCAKSKPLATRMHKGEFLTAALCGLLPCLWLPPVQAALALALVMLVTLLAARYFIRRIGGYTGDCLGAAQQLAEIAFYLGLS